MCVWIFSSTHIFIAIAITATEFNEPGRQPGPQHYLVVFLTAVTGAFTADFLTEICFFFNEQTLALLAGAGDLAVDAKAGTTVATSIAPAKKSDAVLVFMILSP